MIYNPKYNSFKSTNLNSWQPEFNHSFVNEKYKTSLGKDYHTTLRKKNKIECEVFRKLYNKLSVKEFFIGYGFNVPKTYYYANKEENIIPHLTDKCVAKPAHMSESDGVFINEKDFDKINKKLNETLKLPPRNSEPEMMKQAERGIIIEECIDYDYEVKVFVLYGCPIVGDLRQGSKEWNRVDMIGKETKYFNWEKEYEIIKNISKDLKIDFFRIDFFYSKKDNKFYAGELAFRPSTLLGSDIEEFIYQKWKEMVNVQL